MPYLDYHITLIWLPTGIAAAALLRWGNRCWPGIYLGALLTNYSIDSSPLLDGCIAIGNTLAPLLTVWLLRRGQFNAAFMYARDIWVFVFAAAAGMMVSASNGVGSLLAFHVLPGQAANSAWLSWWAGDAVGVLLAAPLLLNISRAALQALWPLRIELLVWCLATIAGGWAVFFLNHDAQGNSLSISFIMMPLTVWAALRFGVTGSSLGVLLPAAIAALATAQGTGPFNAKGSGVGLVLLWVFLATLVLVNLIVAALQAQRKRAELSMQADEEKWRLLFENMSNGFALHEAICDEQGKASDYRFLEVNPAYEQLTGLKAADIIGHTLLEVLPNTEAYWIETFGRVALTGEPTSYENYSRELGRWFHVRVFCPKTGQFAVIVSDITEHKQSEEALRESEARFRTVIEQSPIGLSFARDGRTIGANAAYLKMFGYQDIAELSGHPLTDQIAPQCRAEVIQRVKKRALGEETESSYETTGLRKNGSQFPMFVSAKRILLKDGPLTFGFIMDISERKQAEAELSRIAHFDTLTNIPNRVLLADRMKQAIAHTAREQNMMAVCYLDLDGFKPINDTLGHEAGDQILIEVARRIGSAIRGGDTVARLGGDEFVVLLLEIDQGQECVTTLERLLSTISQPIPVNNKPVTLSASIGVSIYPVDDEDPDTLLRHADQAMYVAKQSGKNCFHIYDPSLDQRARDQHAFLKGIRHALEHNQFELFYQPKINLRTRELVGAEALIRWRHPERGLLSPAEFLRLVENTELDIEIGEWVTAAALAQLNAWRSAGLDIEVSINISGYHLESPRFTENLQQQLARYPDMARGKLQIEVLETVALNDIPIVRGIIESCREMGVGFALDDFGTGYSSLSYLSGLPVDVLKIDQSFVRDMLEDKGDMAIVQGIIALAKAFDRHIVAEGIETQEHYQTLLGMGCETGQGYGIARPMPAGELANWHAAFRA